MESRKIHISEPYVSSWDLIAVGRSPPLEAIMPTSQAGSLDKAIDEYANTFTTGKRDLPDPSTDDSIGSTTSDLCQCSKRCFRREQEVAKYLRWTTLCYGIALSIKEHKFVDEKCSERYKLTGHLCSLGAQRLPNAGIQTHLTSRSGSRSCCIFVFGSACMQRNTGGTRHSSRSDKLQPVENKLVSTRRSDNSLQLIVCSASHVQGLDGGLSGAAFHTVFQELQGSQPSGAVTDWHRAVFGACTPC
jgi:hypothetical protein